ncbi:MAG: tetratricopeptide repeat protein [Deltaproteobacteria bacterium]|jgi:tetratricopeptide (TPR) repeat protein|nr:tetratricopeptide repeat protein [Deltaproteobacteria bacterium]
MTGIAPGEAGFRSASSRRTVRLLPFLLAALFALAPSESPAQQQGQAEILETVESGYLAHRRGDYDQAVEIYTSIIRRRGLTPKQRAVSYLLRGEAKRDKGDLDEAVYDFTRALNQWQNYPQAIFFRGQTLAMLNRLPEALMDYTRAVELDPDRESYRTSLSLLKKRMQDEGLPTEIANSTLELHIPQER